jgi:hypothetical protein
LAGRAAVFFAQRPEQTKTQRIDFQEMDRCFDEFRRHIITEEALERSIQAHKMDWIRFEFEGISFPEEHMIREAIFCVKEDGSSLSEIAGQTKATHWERQVYLEDLHPSFRDTFGGSKIGDLLGPFSTSEGFELYRIVDKVIPSLQDETVRLRAEEDVLNQAVDREINDRVKWHFAI